MHITKSWIRFPGMTKSGVFSSCEIATFSSGLSIYVRCTFNVNLFSVLYVPCGLSSNIAMQLV